MNRPAPTWEPTPQGATFYFRYNEVDIDTMHLRELRDDAEEAFQLSKGCEKLEVFVEDVQQYDKIYVAGNVLSVSDVLKDGKNDTILQFGDNYTEVIMPSDNQITVYRSVE